MIADMDRSFDVPMHPRLAPWPRDIALRLRILAFLEALVALCWIDLCALFGFRAVRGLLRHVPVSRPPAIYDALLLVRVAVRDACVFYVRDVACLQRSAVVTWMLRRRGLPAHLIVGYRAMPLRGHAWVEVHGVVVWDSLPTLAHYRVLDRI